MADFFAPMSDIQSDVMRPIDPLLLTEDGYQRGRYEVGLGSFDVDMLSDQGDHHLGAAPVDAMFRGDVFTPTMDIYGGRGSQFASPALNGMQMHGVPEVLDVFNVARFLFEGR